MSYAYITAPPTTACTIVFPFDDAGNKFDSGFYSLGLTDGRASAEEINQVLSEIDRTRKPFSSQIWASLCCFIAAFMFCLGAFLVFLFCYANNNPDQTLLGIIAFVCGAIGTVVGFIVRVIRLNKVLKEKCQEIVNRVNQSFGSRGLRWHLPIHFPRWIELWKDYQSQGQPVYVPPVVNQQYSPSNFHPQGQHIYKHI